MSEDKDKPNTDTKKPKSKLSKRQWMIAVGFSGLLLVIWSIWVIVKP